MENNEGKKPSSALKAIISIAIAIGALWFFFGGGLEQKAKSDLNKIENQVAEDAVKQYEIAKKQGDKMQTYVQASLVATAYLQAKDEVNYNKWKDIEKEAGEAAGVKEP
ncbi:hypothetical protein CLV51_11015 [Chitinophaga niastensis]|uniref:Uncharacterized protein n=1 Tax=Chitinophaga niastensis TaxID=536980 RepID=A0A2P8H9F6_CHINA|nr:hypothetical protein [Chitinophaga niastensis]PSL42799.1 hypothetical protein CLV51_11015 [Chitinophaga niastensis]